MASPHVPVPIAFTDLTIRNRKPGAYFDEKTPACGIRIGKIRKTWIVIRGRERTRTRIGHYPALPLAEARKKALVLLVTPLDQQQASTFAEWRELYLRPIARSVSARGTRKETKARPAASISVICPTVHAKIRCPQNLHFATSVSSKS